MLRTIFAFAKESGIDSQYIISPVYTKVQLFGDRTLLNPPKEMDAKELLTNAKERWEQKRLAQEKDKQSESTVENNQVVNDSPRQDNQQDMKEPVHDNYQNQLDGQPVGDQPIHDNPGGSGEEKHDNEASDNDSLNYTVLDDQGDLLREPASNDLRYPDGTQKTWGQYLEGIKHYLEVNAEPSAMSEDVFSASLIISSANPSKRAHQNDGAVAK